MINGLTSGELHVGDVAAIEAVRYKGQLYSLNNRRLYAFKTANICYCPMKIVELEHGSTLKRKLKGNFDGSTIHVRQSSSCSMVLDSESNPKDSVFAESNSDSDSDSY